MDPDFYEYLNNNDSSRYSGIGRAEYNAQLRSAFIPVMVIIGFESLIGIIGNSLVFFVFFRRYKTCNFKYFALFLCATDIAACLTSMPLDIVMRYFYFDAPNSIFCKVKFFFLLFILFVETFTLLIISMDRYRKICHPLSWQISNKAALRMCALSLFIAFVIAGLNAIIVIGRHFDEVTFKGTTVVVAQCGSDQKYKYTAISAICIIATQVVMLGILIVMIVLYTCVIRRLYKTKAASKSSKSKTNRKDKTESSFIQANVAPARRKTIIAVTLTIVFGITVTLHTVFLFLFASRVINANNVTYTEWAIYSILYTTYMINYCINPVIYGCLDHQFGNYLRDIKNRVFGNADMYSVDGHTTSLSDIELHRQTERE